MTFSNRGTFRPAAKRTDGANDPNHHKYQGKSRTYTICPMCFPSGVSTCARCQTRRTVLIEDWSVFPRRFYDPRTGAETDRRITFDPRGQGRVLEGAPEPSMTPEQKVQPIAADPAQGVLFA